MEHTAISPAGVASALFATIPLPQEVQSALALHGLRELLFAPIPKLAEVLADLDRDQLGQAIEVMIAMLDASEGDLDIEPNGDELDGSMGEDDFNDHNAGGLVGPGCPVGDPGEHAGDERDISYTEWQGRGRRKLTAGGFERVGDIHSEDAEDDDPDTSVEDGPEGFDPEEDAGIECMPEADPAEHGQTHVYGIDQTKPIEPNWPSIDRRLLKPHRDKIRAERCDGVRSRYGEAYFRLRDETGGGLKTGSALS